MENQVHPLPPPLGVLYYYEPKYTNTNKLQAMENQSNPQQRPELVRIRDEFQNQLMEMEISVSVIASKTMLIKPIYTKEGEPVIMKEQPNNNGMIGEFEKLLYLMREYNRKLDIIKNQLSEIIG